MKGLFPRHGFFAMLAVRTLPFYCMLLVFSLQAHKEERFMYPVYPVLIFAAATTLFAARYVAEQISFDGMQHGGKRFLPQLASKIGLVRIPSFLR